MRKTPPRYIEIAQYLEDSIQQGDYPIGQRLPTEAMLCSQYEISRFTARNALSLLEEKGLIQRTQGRGSVVISLNTSMFKGAWSSIDELLEHASTVRTQVNAISKVTADFDLAHKLGVEINQELIQIEGVRYKYEGGKENPICTLRIWILAEFSGILEELPKLKGSIAGLLENKFGKRSASVEQTVSACIINSQEAQTLNVKEGDAALYLLRKFVDDNNGVYEVSESILPASRFNYQMRLIRN
ncbi:GntR family transcriptional regulator [Marinomonas pollencensis]|uniref:GntR family transcriptional regulator n=1 Tax=Marinomonas pollencensis TaxID=491954 RepID=A0A3E0DT99_9GAMM|nr:GntR family transcriptional regulator [Marinomonas pollencensis]REG86789.1 GntR family transcriptional regulator [Marinomonas pollencensis]